LTRIPIIELVVVAIDGISYMIGLVSLEAIAFGSIDNVVPMGRDRHLRCAAGSSDQPRVLFAGPFVHVGLPALSPARREGRQQGTWRRANMIDLKNKRMPTK